MQRITPVLMFVGNVCGKTEEAINFYASVFKNSPTGVGFGVAQRFQRCDKCSHMNEALAAAVLESAFSAACSAVP